MPFEAETLLARAVKEEVAKLALQRQATAETLAKYVDTSKADGLLYSQAKKFSAALDNEIQFWDKQWQVAKKKQDFLQVVASQKKQAQDIMQVAGVVTGIGAAITAPLLAFSNAYLASAGKTEIAGQRYQDAMYKFQTAEIRVGREVTEALVPGLELAADLAEKISQYAAENPDVVKGLLGLGAGASVLGTVGLSVGLLQKTLADMADLALKLGIGGAGAQGAAAVGAGEAAAGGAGVVAASIVPVVVAVLSLLAGAGIGKYIGDAVNQGTLTPKTGDAAQNVNDLLTNLKLVASAAVGGTGKLLGQNNDWAIAAEKFFGLLKENTPAVNTAANGVQTLKDRISALDEAFKNSPKHDEIIDAYKGYQDSLAKALSDFNQNVIETKNQFAAAVAQEDAAYSKAVNDAYANYEKSSAQTDEAYLAQKAQAEADFNKEMERMAQDHQKKLRDLEESHNDRLTSLAASRDALGIAQENVAYAKTVRDENENYNIEKKRREEDFADQQKQAEAAYQAQKARQAAALADQLSTLAANHEATLAKLKQGEDEKLSALSDSYKKQVDALESGFVDRVRALDGRILEDYGQYQAGLQALGDGFKSWLDDFNSQIVAGWNSGGTGDTGGGTGDDGSSGPGGEQPASVRGGIRRPSEKLIAGSARLTEDRLSQILSNGRSSNANISVTGRGVTMEVSRKIAREEVSSNYDLLSNALK